MFIPLERAGSETRNSKLFPVGGNLEHSMRRHKACGYRSGRNSKLETRNRTGGFGRKDEMNVTLPYIAFHHSGFPAFRLSGLPTLHYFCA